MSSWRYLATFSCSLPVSWTDNVLSTATVTYDYDDFYRASHDVEVNGSDILTTDYTFRSGSAANSTSLMVSSITNAGNGWSDTLTYTYDANGNIETISQNGTLKARFYYDALNQLVREDNAWLGKTIVYTYDKGGNMKNVSEYAYTTGDVSGSAVSSNNFAYSSTNWRDKLTAYMGKGISHDAIGNPLGYYNGFTFDWQNGRQLAGVTGNSLTATYKYNSDGIRTSKTVNGVTTNYTLEGSNVVMETNGTDTIWYYYDASGSLTGFELNGTPYFYVKNLQGDIIAITNASGTKVVEYVYDSWGKLISTTGSLASTVGVKNPYRYRGYRYEKEFGLYYLQSRYYDPFLKRFINADDSAYLGADGTPLSYNLFAYCKNNPVVLTDPFGNWPDWDKLFSGTNLLIMGIAAVSIAATVLTCGAAGPVIMSIAATTVVAGTVTTVNGAAEIAEAFTGYNAVRDGVMGGNASMYENFRDASSLVASGGSLSLGIYSANVPICFVAGTTVLTAVGKVFIEDVETGDYVWASDPETGEVTLKRVVQTFVNESHKLIHVEVDGEEIVCTTEHPFYSPVKGWMAASELRAGDVLVTIAGEYVVVEKIQHEILERPICVYNFEVEDFHTYYVGEKSVLVHNMCAKKMILNRLKLLLKRRD